MFLQNQSKEAVKILGLDVWELGFASRNLRLRRCIEEPIQLHLALEKWYQFN